MLMIVRKRRRRSGGGAVSEKFNEIVCELYSVTLQLSSFVCSHHLSCTICCTMLPVPEPDALRFGFLTIVTVYCSLEGCNAILSAVWLTIFCNAILPSLG